jgi:long-subunit fatty acid transport protein
MGNYVNNLNPAANGELKFTNISVSLNYGFLKLSKSNISDGNVNGINLGIPLSTERGMVLTMGFNSMIRANYKIFSKVTTPDITYDQTYAGNGGISRVNFGLSYKVLGGIYLGAEYNYAFGNQTKLSYLDFGNQLYQNTYIRKENNLTGSFVKGGIIFNINKLLKADKLNDFTLGFVYQSKLNLSSGEDAIYASKVGNDTLRNTYSDIQVPQAFGVGITKQIGKQVILSGDMLMQQWSDFIPGNIGKTNYTNSYRYGLGAEILPALKSDKSFWESLTYRMGVFYDNTYFTINGEKINRYGFGVGFGFPIGNSNSFDLGISVSMRGKDGNGLIQEKYLKLTAGLNFGELWFLRPKDDDR